MDVINLSQDYQKLLDYMKVHGYGKAHINWIKKCIRVVLSDGAKSEIKSYDQLYWYEVANWKWEKDAPCRNAFRSALCCVKQFALDGKYPNWKHQSSLDDKPQKYDLLHPEFKNAVDEYVSWASTTPKHTKTIYIERRAAICFFTHLQTRRKQTFASIGRFDVLSFFYDGDKPVRGHAYISKIMPILKYAAMNTNTDIIRIIGYLPRIPKSYPNYQYLKEDEASKVTDILHKDETVSSLLDKTIVTIAYYTGMRGTDITSLTIDNIDWDKETITLIQSKTGVELILPLTTTVGNAIWRYITSMRPKGHGKEVLVSNRRPFEKLDWLWRHIKNIFNEANVRTDGSRTGVRIFRHHLATSLLANNIASPVISSILGHTSPESVSPYIDADIEHLRECALNISNYPIAEEVFEL
ncbi:MAG: tyrosine-type recombinase/integrase [Tannerellaceae bacterium]